MFNGVWTGRDEKGFHFVRFDPKLWETFSKNEPIMNFSDQETSLLREIQRDASLSLAQLAERVGMAQSTVWRKLQEFEAAGLITGQVTLVDPKRAGCGL